MQRINNNLSRYFNERILRKLQPPSAEMRNAPRSGAHSRTAARTARAMRSHATRHAQRSLSQPPSLWRHTEVCTRMHAGPTHRAKSQRRRTPPSPRRGPQTQCTGSGGTACNHGGCVIRFRVHAKPTAACRVRAGWATAHLGSCAPQRREMPELVARSLARQAGPPCCSTLKSMSSDRLHR